MGAMKKSGRVVKWDATRGFGFIRSPQTDQEIFFHIKDLNLGRAPVEGDEVSFEEIHVGGKGPRAVSIHAALATFSKANFSDLTYANPPFVKKPDGGWSARGNTMRPSRPPVSRLRARRNRRAVGVGFGFLILICSWIAALWLGVVARRLPGWAPLAAIALNSGVFCTYWLDKNAAQKRQWRTKEDTLHIMALLGGWPGAGLAQQILRHKSRKDSFRQSFQLTVIAHWAALLAWLFWLQPRLMPGGFGP
jgi:uncharacterized membrane protein YsdA (DUF1294 family)/cold shock CspA family protein